jgi:hypothetical protein
VHLAAVKLGAQEMQVSAERGGLLGQRAVPTEQLLLDLRRGSPPH